MNALAVYDAVQAGRDDDARGIALLMTAVAIALLYLVNKLTARKAHGF